PCRGRPGAAAGPCRVHGTTPLPNRTHRRYCSAGRSMTRRVWQRGPMTGMARASWLLHALAIGALALDALVGGTGGASPTRITAPAATASPVPTPTVPVANGLDEGWTVDNDGNVLVTPEKVATTRSAGARYVRVNFRLGSFSDWSNPTLLAAYDLVVNRFVQAGIQVLGLVTSEATTDSSQADWTANNYEHTGGNGDNPFIAITYVQDALVPLLRHFHDRVTRWELWNEPNAATSCTGTVCTGGSFIYPSNFAALLVDAYTAIKDYGGLNLSDVTLIAGGLLGHSIGGVLTPGNAGVDYLLNTFSRGTGSPGTWHSFMRTRGGAFPYPLDGLGQHLYIDQNRLTTHANISAYYAWLHGAPLPYVTPGPTPAALPPTYMTEGAWSTGVVSQATQAQDLDVLFQTTRGMGFVPAATWFELQDNPPANLYFGLIDQTGTNKESFSHYQTQSAVSTATATPTSVPRDAPAANPTQAPTGRGARTTSATATSGPTASQQRHSG
ncbi:MAG TPA: hypothetical protein VHB98_17830, partial [Chloroflexota bacterium]|nr:hypothetical protein [Chloroflexota bacterium]